MDKGVRKEGKKGRKAREVEIKVGDEVKRGFSGEGASDESLFLACFLWATCMCVEGGCLGLFDGWNEGLCFC